MAPDNVSPVELRLLVLREAILPLVQLARIAGLSLDDLNALVSSAYYREFRHRGHSHQMMTGRIGKSLRSVANLAKRDKEAARPLDGSELVNAKRDVATRVGKSSVKRSEVVRDHARALGPEDGHELVETAIDQLIEEGILDADDANDEGEVTLRQGAGFLSLVGKDAEHRLASLRHLLTGTTAVIYHRFFRRDEPDTAFARVLSFRVREDQLQPLADVIYAAARAAVVHEDEASSGTEPPVTLTMTLSREPSDREW